MDEYTYLLWLQAIATGTPPAGSYIPGTNPLDAMTAP